MSGLVPSSTEKDFIIMSAVAAPKKKRKVANRNAQPTSQSWQPGEVDPYDLGTPYERVPAPLTFASKPKKKARKILPLPNQLYTGDSIEVMEKWPDSLFDACITDPPYNIARNRKGLSWAKVLQSIGLPKCVGSPKKMGISLFLVLTTTFIPSVRLRRRWI